MRLTTCLLGLAMILAAAASQAAPGLINYQGRLTDLNGRPISSQVNVTFTFWSAPTGGVQLGGFSDTDAVTPSSQGLYSTFIGDEGGVQVPPSIFSAAQVWLNVRVGNENLLPRKRFSSVAYALQSDQATTAAFALAAAGALQIPAIAPPASLANRLANTSASLYWNGAPLQSSRGEAFVIVQTVADATSNALNLVSAYNRARLLKPHGQDLCTTNRVTVLVPPGRYDLGVKPLVMDAEYVDLIGLSTSRDDQVLFGTLLQASAGLLRQKANNVRIENLLLECYNPNTLAYGSSPSAYSPDAGTTQTVIRNCEFRGKKGAWSMRPEVNYPGTYQDCKAGNNAFGNSAAASGVFINCVGGVGSFGSFGVASGVFKNCTAGGDSFGVGGVASGQFTDCVSGEWSFGYYGKATGTFIRCNAKWTSFGSYGVASGTFTDCVAEDYSFGFCGLASGAFTNCTAGYDSFGSGTGSTTATASGVFTNCKAGSYSFGSGSAAKLTTFSGVCTGCTAGSESFGVYADNARAQLSNCRMTGASWSGAWNGRMENCQWSVGLTCGPTARIYGSTFAGTLNLNNTAAGVTQCRAKSILNAGSNVFGATNAAALNLASAAVQ